MNDLFLDIKRRLKDGDILTKLILVNVLVYLVLVTINMLATVFTGDNSASFVENIVYPFLQFDSHLLELVFKPWTLVAHQFTHSLSPRHVFFNMLLLYFLGKLFLKYFSPKQLLGLYLLGGFFSAFLLIVAGNLSPLFPDGIIAIGASASAMAISVAVCSYAPKNEIHLFGFIKVQLQWVGIVLVLSDLIFFKEGNPGGHIGHWGGAITGYVFATKIRSGKDITKQINNLISFTLRIFKKNKAGHLSVEYSKSTRNMSDEEYNVNKNSTQETIDQILDKIGKNGYDSLSKREKDILAQNSK